MYQKNKCRSILHELPAFMYILVLCIRVLRLGNEKREIGGKLCVKGVLLSNLTILNIIIIILLNV